MPLAPETDDLSGRVAELQAIAREFDDLCLELNGTRGRAGEIAADTRWTSKAMTGYEDRVSRWRDDMSSLQAQLEQASGDVRAVAGEVLFAQLARTFAPGSAVVR